LKKNENKQSIHRNSNDKIVPRDVIEREREKQRNRDGEKKDKQLSSIDDDSEKSKTKIEKFLVLDWLEPKSYRCFLFSSLSLY